MRPPTIPRGLLRNLTRYIYSISPRPVRVISFATAFAFLSNLCGRQYNINGTGLNQYILLLADTGTGKDITAEATSTLFDTLSKEFPRLVDYLGPRTFASGQALVKHFGKERTTFLSVLQEFGITLQEISNPTANSANAIYRQVLLDLYSMSGRNKTLQPFVYSDKTKNTETIKSPSLTLLCEGTRDSFYDGLHERMISMGLIPRFFIIEYDGLRPRLNTRTRRKLRPMDKTRLENMVDVMMRNADKELVVDIEYEKDAFLTQQRYDERIDDQMNSNKSDTYKQLWNRAHLKAIRLAGVMAVCQDCKRPRITKEQMEFAVAMVDYSIGQVEAKIERGEFGVGSSRHISDVIAVAQEYKSIDWTRLKRSRTRLKYTTKDLHTDKIISYQYISRIASSKYSFRNSQGSISRLIHDTVDELLRRGELRKVPQSYLKERHGVQGEYYKIHLP